MSNLNTFNLNTQNPLISEALRLASIRERLSAENHVCVSCDTQQVQLVYHLQSPAKFRCRICRHVWFVPYE